MVGNTLISHLWGLQFKPRTLCGKVGSCLPMVGSLQCWTWTPTVCTDFLCPQTYPSWYNLYSDLFIWGFYVTFNTVQVISWQVVGRAEETSTYSWCQDSVLQTADQRQATTSFPTWGRAGNRTPISEVGGESVHSATVAPLYSVERDIKPRYNNKITLKIIKRSLSLQRYRLFNHITVQYMQLFTHISIPQISWLVGRHKGFAKMK